MTEAQHQGNVFKWAKQPAVRAEYPELKLLYHIKNETMGGATQVAIDKAQGVKKGVPDLHLPVARGKYHSLYIEMKTEKGKTSPEQDWWIPELAAQGNFCEVCHGWESAVRVLRWYLDL